MARSDSIPSREVTAQRLLRASVQHSYDPAVDIDWQAPLLPDALFLPAPQLSLYRTELWQGMSHGQRVELSRCELANSLSFGMWVESSFIQMLIRHSFSFDPASAHLRYALTEIADECRHSTMFSQVVAKLERGPYPPNRFDHLLTTLLRGYSTKPLAWVAVLFVEEIFDMFQREGLKDDSVQPLSRQVFRIHVIEEARHMRFAREELVRVVPRLSRAEREALAISVGLGLGLIARALRNPRMYAQAGLDPREAVRQAVRNEHVLASRRDSVRRLSPFYEELGLLTPTSRRLWRRSGFAA
ncbi:diiron oxygenase [Kutzneria viridogrisea]|uniref:p-aminobenzoate N-oxygenase AurF n=2 Tax=Kutzneria TaxID=43356 RepID=W5W5Q5_9PSEU|nr:diiron oxygenase [Kutzneria albida]AHH96553.1 hypothetical protein KALB_3186 [Kutzneria albida DSM 43870]MBA8928227.1 hypothetical protein [Kutzneria viridogrisea]